MTDAMTLEQMAALAARLPPQDQLRLVAEISAHLSTMFSGVVRTGTEIDVPSGASR